MAQPVPAFSCSCIDFRFTEGTTTLFDAIKKDYFDCSVAGAALANAYSTWANNYNKKTCGCKTDPENTSMSILKINVNENLKIARTLQPISDIFFVNHQDCGAIKAFLPNSGYPKELGSNNKREIVIHSQLLRYAKDNMLSWAKNESFPQTNVSLKLVDYNGSIASYNTDNKTWVVDFIGAGPNNDGVLDSRGLWFGLNIGDTYEPFKTNESCDC